MTRSAHRALVADGYDAMADTWEDCRAAITADPRAEWLDALIEPRPRRARGGRARVRQRDRWRPQLAETHRAWSASTSRRSSCASARRACPARPSCSGDLTTVEFDPDRSMQSRRFYVFNHVPRERLADARSRACTRGCGRAACSSRRSAPRPRGLGGRVARRADVLLELPAAREPRAARMRASSCCATRSSTIAEPEGDVAFQWVLAGGR